MVVVSAVLHIVVIVMILTVTNRKDSESSPRLMSHAVELVDPALLGPTSDEGGSKTKSGPAALPLAEPKSFPQKSAKLEKTDPQPVKRLPEPAQRKPEKPPVKEPPSLKPLQVRKEVEQPQPKEPPPSKAKETPKVVAAKPAPPSEPSVEKPKPVEPVKPKDVVQLPEKRKKTEPKPAKKTEDTPEPEKVVKKLEKKPVEKARLQTKNLSGEKNPPEKKLKETTQKSASPPATRAKAQPVEEQEEKETQEREQQIVAAMEKIRAGEEATRREKEIAAALERVRKGVTTGERKGSEGDTRRETPGPSVQEEEGNTEKGPRGGGGAHGTEFIAYTQYLKQRVKEAWILAERRPGLRAVVRFGVEPNGEVMEVELADSSGDRSFDQSALRAVRKASPFPSPPEAYREEFATQKVEITFSGEERIR